ncbi:MAG: acetolactate synthase large subunit [Nitrospirae bacterium]|nr:acetolactate synthase large subunit [Candidatus Manganitrophaceae bacterium]
MKASDLFVKCLENEGVEYIFGIPGEENLDLLESLRHSSIKLILTRHEQGAGFMAATYGRLTGKTGVCLATLGPGATNFVTCASYALLGGMPVLFITGQKPIKKSKQGRFQIIDVVQMMQPITKFSKQIVDANNIPHLLRDCFRIAASEKPGAVHLELPEDIAAETTDRQPFPVTEVDAPRASWHAIERAVEMIEAAERPLLLIASGANRNIIHEELSAFIDATGLYFCNTQMGKGAIDERHAQFLGTAALSADDYLHCAINRSDLIINVGHDVTEKPPFFMDESGRLKVIHVSFYPAQMDDIYFPQHEVIGCLRTNIQKMTKQIKKSPLWDFDYFRRIKDEIETHIYKAKHQDCFPNTPQQIVAEIRETVSEDAILSFDNGMYKIWFARNYKAYHPNTVLLDNALATMGAGLPVAIGAKLVCPETQVVAICGDGGFMMNSQEMETAVRLKLHLVVIVLRDNAYGMIKWKQAGSGFADFGLDFGNPDFVLYAQSYGAKGHRITKNGELQKILAQCLHEPAVHLIEVPIDYSENERVFFKELKEKTCLL